MIKLPKKIQKTIEELLTQDYFISKKVFIDSPYKDTKVNLIVIKIANKQNYLILRYFGDNSYSLLSGYNDIKEVSEELAYQIYKLSYL